ncbi:MAG: GNAT family N-acetyltransferase [Bacteroidia bacterium]
MDITTKLSKQQLADILALWNAEYPAVIAFDDVNGLEAYLAGLQNPRHYLVLEAEKLVGWLCVMEREAQPWFIILLDASIQGKGVGSSLMKKAMQNESILHGWVVIDSSYQKASGEPYPSPWPFYQKLGFELCPNITLEKGGIRSTMIRWERG